MSSGTKELAYRISFSLIKGMTQTLARQVLSRVGTEEAFFTATPSQLASLMGNTNQMFRTEYREALLAKGRAEVDFVTSNSIRCLYFTDDEYPQRLHTCDDAPIMLYAIGDANLNGPRTVGIVGTRHATPYGSAFVERLVKELSEKVEGVTTLSGLAFGIDVAGHKASLEAGLPTIGVLAHGLSTIYPAVHRSVAARMVKSGGALVTEYVHDARIHRSNFLARNRIVAGMSDCLFVAESAIKGGAMVTANIASCYGRDVFALPGRTSDAYSAGCNRLIASNLAALVVSSDDLIASMGWPTIPREGEQQAIFADLTDDERTIIDALTTLGEAQMNQLSVNLGFSINKLMGLLVDMEFKGLIINYPGGRYRLS